MAGLSSCGAVKSNAIRVGDFEMSKADFETELESASANAQVAQQFGGARSADRKWNAAFVADTLNNIMIWQAIDAEASEKNLKVKAIDPAIKERIVQAFGGEKEFAKLPKDFRDRQFLLSTQVNALIESETANLGTPEEYFEKNRAEFPAEVCASHILIPTEEEALAAKKRIDGGEAFAKVADELTQDPGGKGKGGDLGCASPASYVAEFAAAVTELKIDEVSVPVQTEFGFHVIKVTARNEATFASVKDKITADLQQQGSLTAQTAVFGRLTPKTVSVDPSLGSIVTNGQFLQIAPPKLKVASTVTTTPPAAVQP